MIISVITQKLYDDFCKMLIFSVMRLILSFVQPPSRSVWRFLQKPVFFLTYNKSSCFSLFVPDVQSPLCNHLCAITSVQPRTYKLSANWFVHGSKILNETITLNVLHKRPKSAPKNLNNIVTIFITKCYILHNPYFRTSVWNVQRTWLVTNLEYCHIENIHVPTVVSSNIIAKLFISGCGPRSRPWKGRAKFKGQGQVITLHQVNTFIQMTPDFYSSFFIF